MVQRCHSSSSNTDETVEALRERIRHLEELVAQRPQEWTPDDIAHLQRLAVVGELCAEMAHEVNQPLAAIKWFAEAARLKLQQSLGDHPSAEELLEIIGTIEQQAAVCQQLTGRLFGTARHSKSDRRQHTFSEILEDVLPLVRVLADRYAVSIETEGVEQLPAVMADRLQLGQVLLNLVRNAVEAVALCPPERRRVIVRGRELGDTVEITVRDFGVGVPDEVLHRLFERFFTTRPGGTGLGLAISKSIIESHGGAISVDKNDDYGLSFRFTLPSALAESEERDE